MIKRLTTLLLLAGAQLLSAASEKPNIVFLLVDDLGRGDFGCYGAQFYETPNIDKLAAEGMLFTNAYAACTVCSPSRAAILTGCYPARTHLTDWITGHDHPFAKLSVPDWNMRIDHERVVLPEALKAGGYDTAFFGKWHLMPNGQADEQEHYPTDHGFDLNIGGREWGQPKGPGKYFSPFDMPNLDDGKPGDFLTDKLTDAAIKFLDNTKRDNPFLLYFSYYTLHGPIMAPPAYVEKYKEKAKGFDNAKDELLDPARAGMVEILDNSIGRIVSKLEELGIAENTIIILTGDNGGDNPKTSGGFRDFKGFSHEGGVREPFLVKWPAKIKSSSKSDATVIGMDIYPTLLDAAGMDLLPEEHKDGISILPVLEDGSAKLERDSVFWHYPHYHRTKPYGAIRHGDLKLIEFFETGELELYDLSSDPAEKNNLAKSQPEKAAALLAELREWRKSVGAQMMTENPDYDPEREEHTRKGDKISPGPRRGAKKF
ncbi:sulfatase [Luteolibacter algae]|uniref:Sulfatase n=1 Tax=Luteolibacter algae TaxID=454151 RepID=A0ABW5D7A0_9BACT